MSLEVREHEILVKKEPACYADSLLTSVYCKEEPQEVADALVTDTYSTGNPDPAAVSCLTDANWKGEADTLIVDSYRTGNQEQVLDTLTNTFFKEDTNGEDDEEKPECVSVAAIRANLYAGHWVKEELVIGPEVIQHAKKNYEAPTSPCPTQVEPSSEDAEAVKSVPSDCFVRLERLPLDCMKNSQDSSIKNKSRWVYVTHNIVNKTQLYVCDTCRKQFSKRNSLIQHLQTHSIAYTCDICKKKYATKNHLREHALLHIFQMHQFHSSTKNKTSKNLYDTINKTQIYICDTCRKHFSKRNSLIEHLRTHIKTYICDICKKKYATKNHLREHALLHIFQMHQFHSSPKNKTSKNLYDTINKTQIYICDTCRKQFSKRISLIEHLRTHIKTYTCDICKHSVTEDRLREHAQLHIFKTQQLDSSTKNKTSNNIHDTHHTINKTQIYICDTCRKQFYKRNSLIEHLRTHNKGYTCDICKNKYATKSRLKEHALLHIFQKKLYSCKTCNKNFTLQKSLSTHEIIHAPEKHFACDVCQRKFTQSGSLTRHKRIHTGEKPYLCKICKKAFTTKAPLKNHLRVHTGEKPYVCAVCNKRFTSLQRLKEHRLLHDDAKPHSCDICQKRYTYSANLDRHKLTHTSEKRYLCDECGQKFYNPFFLKAHKVTHLKASERPLYSCQICKKQYLYKYESKRHYCQIRKKPFACDICAKRYKEETGLLKHLQKHYTSTMKDGKHSLDCLSSNLEQP